MAYERQVQAHELVFSITTDGLYLPYRMQASNNTRLYSTFKLHIQFFLFANCFRNVGVAEL